MSESEQQPLDILIVDDDAVLSEALRRFLSRRGHHVETASNSRIAMDTMRHHAPEMIILDLQMPEIDGPTMLRHLASDGFAGAILLHSGASVDVLRTSRNLGASLGLRMADPLSKPYQLADLSRMLDRVQVLLATSPRRQSPVIPATVAEVERALERDQFRAFFQPKIDLATGALAGAEALARWVDPKNGVQPPIRFIHTCEQNGLIDALTDRMVADALMMLASLNSRSTLHLRIAVNLSPHSLADVHLPERLARQAQKYDVPPERLVLELTETTSATEPAQMMEVLTRLRLQGFSLSLDDFGTGTSSLVQLYRMPFTELKLDRSFVANVLTDAEAKVIVKSTLGMCLGLGLHTVAEGVETAGVARFLAAAGCELAQGYLWAKPLPAGVFRAWTPPKAAAPLHA